MSPLHCANAPATARLFVQLGMRQSAGCSGLPVLDVLLPALSRAVVSPAARSYHARSASSNLRSRYVLSRSDDRIWRSPTSHHASLRFGPSPLRPGSRSFSTSSPRTATHAVFNRQVDDDGNEMVLEITPRAAKRLSEIMTKDSNPNLALRIQVESGGCHGFQYLMKLVTLPAPLPADEPSSTAAADEDPSAPVRSDDTIFTYAADGSSAPGDLAAPKIILDLPSLELLKGSKVDFTMELIGSQFKIVDNPLATSSCGCGTSFDIKI